MQATADVVVVGRGAIGLMAARTLRLGAPDMSVVVVGPASAPGAASEAAGAMLSHHGEVTKYTRASEEGRLRHDLVSAAHRLWPQLLRELSGPQLDSVPLTIVEGTHVVLNGRSGRIDSDNFQAILESLEDSGVAHELDVEVPGLDPLPDARPLRSIFLPHEGGVDARALLRRLEASCRQLGVNFVDATAVRLEAENGRLARVHLDTEESIACGVTVVAAGSLSRALVAPLLAPDAVQPMLAGSGVALLTERVLGAGFRTVVRSVNRAGSCGLHVVPLGGGREYFGATNVLFAEAEHRVHLGVAHFVADGVMDQLDQMAVYSRIDGFLVGNRPVPLDGFPLIGPTTLEGLIVLSGTYRDGLHMAPLLAQLTYRFVLDGQDDFPHAFRPEREVIETMTCEQSVDEFVLNSVSSAFEGRTRLSPFIHHEELANVYRAKALAVYQRIDSQVALGPDIVTFLALSRKREEDVDAVAAYLRARRP